MPSGRQAHFFFLLRVVMLFPLQHFEQGVSFFPFFPFPQGLPFGRQAFALGLRWRFRSPRMLSSNPSQDSTPAAVDPSTTVRRGSVLASQRAISSNLRESTVSPYRG